MEVIFRSLSKNDYRCFKWHLIILAGFIDISVRFYYLDCGFYSNPRCHDFMMSMRLPHVAVEIIRKS